MANVNRLLKLRAIVPHIEELDMWTWSACIAGNACTDPELNKEGLTIEREKAVIDGGYIYYPSFKGYTSWEALSEFFALSPENTRMLFCVKKYPQGMTDQQILQECVKRIDDIIYDHIEEHGPVHVYTDVELFNATVRVHGIYSNSACIVDHFEYLTGPLAGKPLNSGAFVVAQGVEGAILALHEFYRVFTRELQNSLLPEDAHAN